MHFVPGHSAAAASDFRVFYSAALVLLHGGSPYHQPALVAVEQHVRRSAFKPAPGANYAYLPLVAWLLIPLTLLPFWGAWGCFTMLGVAVTWWSVWALSKRLGWVRPWLVATSVELVWITLWGFLLGQFDAVLLGALTAAILARWRGSSVLAGAVLSAAWIKPQLLLPAVPIIALSFWPARDHLARCVLAFLGATAALLALETWACPGLLLSWWRYLHAFSASVPAAQGHGLAGLIGLTSDLPQSWGISDAPTGALSVAVASIGALTAMVVAVHLARERACGHRRDRPAILAAIGFPLGIWLLAGPYSHLNDLLLLFPLVLLVVGVDARNLKGPLAWSAVLALVLVPFVEAALSFRFNLLPLVVLMVLLAAALTPDGIRLGYSPVRPSA